MSLRHKQLAEITEADLLTLKENQVSESREIEYKAELLGKRDDDKCEFLYDVSSFANCIGGDLVYGVSESQGIPTEVHGIQISDPDQAILRLENIIRDGIQPRVMGVATHVVSLASSKSVIIIRIPRSWIVPHMVAYQGRQRFYSRNSRGKYPLDVGELRAAFLGSGQLTERVRNFRLERLARITNGDAPAPLPDTAKLILQIVPFRAFEPGAQFDLTSLRRDLAPIFSSGYNGPLYNFDGLLTVDERYDPQHNVRRAASYLQVFRNGIIETVDVRLFSDPDSQQPTFHGKAYEHDLIGDVQRLLSIQEGLGVDAPLILILTFTGVQGYRIWVSPEAFSNEGTEIDRDVLLIPEVVVTDYADDIPLLLKPVFDTVWNAAGWQGSPNYDPEGKWIPRQ